MDLGNNSRSPGSSVPLSQKNINTLMDHYFKAPRFFPRDLTVSVAADMKIIEAKGLHLQVILRMQIYENHELDFIAHV